MDVDALRAVQTSGPTTPSTCFLRAGPFYQFGQKYEFARKIQKTNRGGTQMKIKEASKNDANELKYYFNTGIEVEVQIK